MSRLCLLASIICWTNAIQAAPHLSRQWTRSTLEKPNLHFRHMNRMSPLLTDDMVIQGNGIDGIKAFHRGSGREIWSRQFINGVEGGATVEGDRLYFGSNNGFFYCLNVVNGDTLWKYQVNSESLTEPTVQGPYVFHVTGNNTLYAFDKLTGRSIWVKTNAAKSNMTIRGQSVPRFENGILYLGFSDGSFTAINALNGRELWSKRIGDDKKFNDVDANVVVSSQCLLISSYSNALYCIDKSNGRILWRHDSGGYNAVFLDQDKIYFPTTNKEIHILDQASGKLLKKIVDVKGLATEIVGYDEYIVYGESSGALVFRDKKSLKRVFEFNPGRGIFAHPTIDQETGEVYIVSNQANLYRLDYKVNPENRFLWSGWPL